MTRHYRLDTTLGQPRHARDIGYRLAQICKQQGMTQAQVAWAIGVSQVRISRMEHGDTEKMQVESIAAYVAAISEHLRLVADFGHATTTFIDYTEPAPPDQRPTAEIDKTRARL